MNWSPTIVTLKIYSPPKSVLMDTIPAIHTLILPYENDECNNTASLTLSHIVVTAHDMKKVTDSCAGLIEISEENIVNLLNHHLREPRRLVFYEGALFESTVNTDNYAKS